MKRLELHPTPLRDCVEIRAPIFADDRGMFVKPYHQGFFAEHGLPVNWAESYWSRSHRGVVRGFHFQHPPHDHAKLVSCVAGEILDVAVDLRRGSPTYGQAATVRLSPERGNALLIPSGFGHAFQALADDTTVVYLVSSTYSPEHESGIRWDSAGIAWPVPAAAVSPRDTQWRALAEFETPFTYEP